MELLFWICFVVFFVIQAWLTRSKAFEYLPLWVLTGILGAKVFGSPF